jgi:DNA polymerase-3 subunit beta
MQVSVNVKYIRSLRHLMAHKDVRYYLRGVSVKMDKRGKFYVATNGHVLGAYFEPWAENEEAVELDIIVPGDVVKAAKPSRHLDHGFLQSREDGRFEINTGDTIHTFTPIDGKFPDWSRVIPRTVSLEPAHFDFDYLANFNACARDGWDSKHGVELFHNGDSAALVLNGCKQFVGAIMPKRMERSPKESPTMPEWL